MPLSAADSTGLDYDSLVGFYGRVDRINLPGSVAGWSGEMSKGILLEASFNLDLAAAVNDLLDTHSAVFFIPGHGDLAGQLFAIVDLDGDGAYRGGADLVLRFVSPPGPIPQMPDIFI